jgi:hypothetical protein
MTPVTRAPPRQEQTIAPEAPRLLRTRRGPVAQWSELAAQNRLVGGSSPPGPTMNSLAFLSVLALIFWLDQ